MNWRQIDGYPNYQVSDSGRVRSVSRVINGRQMRGRVLKADTDKDGYQRVTLYKRGGRRNSRIHILVAIAFLSYKPGYDVNHLDRDKTNNAVNNLEVITHRENMRHWMEDEGILTPF